MYFGGVTDDSVVHAGAPCFFCLVMHTPSCLLWLWMEELDESMQDRRFCLLYFTSAAINARLDQLLGHH